jgi:hypothetical protein
MQRFSTCSNDSDKDCKPPMKPFSSSNRDYELLSFGELESMLAAVHDIADDKRTAFQARIKNFQRLGYPPNLKTEKGRATKYQPGDICLIALAFELTQLGLSPERTKHLVYANRLPTTEVIRKSAQSLLANEKGFSPFGKQPASHFLCFDPLALEALIKPLDPKIDDLVFWANEKNLTDLIVSFSGGTSSRVGVVNVTSMVDLIAPNAEPKRQSFLTNLEKWSVSGSGLKWNAKT